MKKVRPNFWSPKTNIFLLALVFLGYSACVQKTDREGQGNPSGENSDGAPQGAAANAAATVNFPVAIKPPVPVPSPPAVGVTRMLSLSQGSKGFKYFVSDYDPKTKRFSQIYSGTTNHAGQWDKAGIDEFVDTLDSQLKKVMTAWSVPGKNVRAFSSSGFKTQVAAQYDYYVKQVKSKGYILEPINANDEAYYGFLMVVPPDMRGNTNYHDVGGSNGKNRSGDKSSSFDYGARTATGVERNVIKEAVNSSLGKLPNYFSRDNVLFFGGGPYLAGCFINAALYGPANKTEMAYFDFTEADLRAARAKMADVSMWDEFVKNSGMGFYEQAEALNAVDIMLDIAEYYTQGRQERKGTEESITFTLANSEVDWTAAKTAAYVLGSGKI